MAFPGLRKNNKSELVKLVNDEYDRRTKERKAFELQWRLNIEFVAGNQYCDLDYNTNEIRQLPKMYDYQMREVYNHLAPILETRQAKLGRVNPTLITRPATNDREDLSSARVSTSVVKGHYRDLNMHEKIREATAWSELCGTVLYEQQWDSETGQTIADVDGKEVQEGGPESDVCSPFEILPDSCFSKDVDSCKSIIRAKAYHVDEIMEIWGKSVRGRKVDIFNLEQTSLGTGGLGYTANTMMAIPRAVENHEIVKQYYSMPCKRFPKGAWIIVAGDELLFHGDLLYRVGENSKLKLPFVRQVCIKKPGYFWGTSITERLIPIQRAYNAVKNRKHEYLNRLAIGILTYEDGTIDVETVESEGLPPGGTVPYSRGARPPNYLQSERIGSEFREEEQSLLNDFTIISGVSTFSRSSLPPIGANSGIAMEIVQEQDDTRLSATAENIRDAIPKIGKQWLLLDKQFAKTERILSYIGKNNKVHVVYWDQSDITSTDVIIETENELSQTPAQRKQFILDLDARGVFNDPETGLKTKRGIQRMLQMLQLGDNWENAADVSDSHVNRALRENMRFESGEVPMIEIYDDDDIHLEEHMLYVLSEDFEDMKREDPEIAQVMLAHVEQHLASIQFKKMQGQMPMQGQMQQSQVMAG